MLVKGGTGWLHLLRKPLGRTQTGSPQMWFPGELSGGHVPWFTYIPAPLKCDSPGSWVVDMYPGSHTRPTQMWFPGELSGGHVPWFTDPNVFRQLVGPGLRRNKLISHRVRFWESKPTCVNTTSDWIGICLCQYLAWWIFVSRGYDPTWRWLYDIGR